MRVHVVGASGTFPTASDPGSGYVIENDETRVWCDAGPGTFVRLPFDPDLIDFVVISHRHPDHCTDVFTAYHPLTFRPEPRTGIPLFASEDVLDHLAAFTGKGRDEMFGETFDIQPVGDADSVEIGSLKVRFVEMNHSAHDLGSEWDGDGRTLFFTGDTGPGDWESKVGAVDVMLSEAALQGTRGESDDILHLYAREAGAIARASGAKRLVLTHIPPYMDKSISVAEAEETFGRAVQLAVSGTSFDV